MALWDEVKLRYPNRFLTTLTSINDDEAKVPDDTQGGRAADQAEGMFLRFALLDALDLADSQEVGYAAAGTILVLRGWGSEGASTSKDLRDWRNDVVQWAKNDKRKRVTPTTSSLAQTEIECGKKRWSDATRFEGIEPNAPPAQQSCDNDGVETDLVL